MIRVVLVLVGFCVIVYYTFSIISSVVNIIKLGIESYREKYNGKK